MNILIPDITIVSPSGLFKRTIVIEDGMITALASGRQKRRTADATIDGADLLAFPGFLDMHVHLREPGFEYKEDIATGLAAAFHGGFTAVACMANTSPVNDDPTVTRFMKERAAATGLPVDLHPIAAITKGLKGEQLAEMQLLHEAGAVAFSDDGHPVTDSSTLRRALEYAATFDLPVICHSEETSLSAGGQIHDGTVALRTGLRGIPREAEYVAVERDIALARMTGARIHIAHVSTRESVDAIRRAKKDDVRVTAETCPQYCLLTDEAASGFDTAAKINPPLRTADDVGAVRAGLKDRTIDVIASDHAPHHADEKDREFDRAPFGMIGLESMLPLCLELVREGILDFEDLAAKLSRNPHTILGLRPPRIQEGEDAVITIVDPRATWTYDRTTIHSKSTNTPFLGRTFQGRARYIIKGGTLFEIQ